MLHRPVFEGIITRRRAVAAAQNASHYIGARSVHSSIGALSKGGIEDPTSYCDQLVRKHDYDSYLTSPFFPGDSRKGFLALKAFSVRAMNSKRWS
jgi:hypothetical protein